MVIFIKCSTLKALGMLNPFGKEMKCEKKSRERYLKREQFACYFYHSIVGFDFFLSKDICVIYSIYSKKAFLNI